MLEIFWNAIPRMPSIGSPANLSESVVTAEKACFVAVMPATVTVGGPSVSGFCGGRGGETYRCR